MPKITEIVEELRFVSDRISTQVRTLALGLLAISWAILVGDSTFLKELAEGVGRKLLLIGGISVLVLFLDFLQYVTAYIYVDGARKDAEERNNTEVDYPLNWLRNLRTFFFWAKQIALIFALVLFLFILVRFLYIQGPTHA